MKSFKQLREKYIGIATSKRWDWDTTFTLFENPSRSELNDIGKNVRTIITPDKMYIWTSSDALHYMMTDAFPETISKKPYILAYGKAMGKSLKLFSTDGTYKSEARKIIINNMLQKHKYLNRMFPKWRLEDLHS